VFERRWQLEEMDDALAAALRQRYRQVLQPCRRSRHENPHPAPEEPELAQGRVENRLYPAPFRDNGLFAITGPTGAGKSTCWMPSAWRSTTKRHG
jgi:Tfp pilus assembly pilus retraction ATPase PilT